MKLHDFQLQTFTKWITFIPTIEVHIDNPMYTEKNIALILNIFIWHFRWLFIKEREEKMIGIAKTIGRLIAVLVDAGIIERKQAVWILEPLKDKAEVEPQADKEQEQCITTKL